MLVLIPTFPFKSSSAGIFSQHKLCHILRENKYDARLVMVKGEAKTNPEWNTPIWNGLGTHDFSVGIYSELFNRNPLDTTYSIRWVLGQEVVSPKLDPSDVRVFFWHSEDNSQLKLSILDQEFFSFKDVKDRKGLIAYRGKNSRWRINNENELNVKYIDRFGPNSVSRKKLKLLLQQSLALVVGEDTLVIEEAIISGCPVIVRPRVKLPEEADQIPSIYFQKDDSDWPDFSQLHNGITVSKQIVLEKNLARDLTVINLFSALDSLRPNGELSKPPRTSLRKSSKIRLVRLRIVSALSRGGVIELFPLFLDAIRNRMSP